MNRPTASNASGVHVAYTLTADDVARAFQLHYRAQMRRWPALAAGLVSLLILVDAAAILLAGDARGLAFVVACGVFGGVAVPAAMLRFVVPLRARRLHARSRLLREPIVLDADAAGVRVEAPDTVIHRPWAGVVRWRESRHVLLLYHADAQFLIVPRRTLAPGARDALRGFHDAARRLGPVGEPARADAGGRAPRVTRSDTPVLATSGTWVVTRADLAAAQRLFLRWHWRRPQAHAVPVFLAACAGVVAAASAAAWAGVATAMLTVLLGFVALDAAVYAFLPLLAGRFRRRQPDLGLPWRVELDPRGLRAITPEQDVRTPWGEYVAWAEDARVLLVYRSDAVFQFLPTRALDPEFVAAFRGLVSDLPRR